MTTSHFITHPNANIKGWGYTSKIILDRRCWEYTAKKYKKLYFYSLLGNIVFIGSAITVLIFRCYAS